VRRLLPSFAYSRPVTVIVTFVALLVLGALAWVRVPMQLMPDGFEPRFLWVWVPYANSTPTETDDVIVSPIEEQLSTLSGVKVIRSRARPDSATFAIEFHPSIDMDEAYNDTVDRLERAMPDLPEEVERYGVFKFNPDDEPIVWAGVTFPDEVDDPYRVVNKVIIPQIERVPGVASVDSWGSRSRRIFVDYDRDRMLAHGVNLEQVQRSLGNDNFQMSGGRITSEGAVRHVRSLARFPDAEVLERYPINGDGLVLGDIADISLRGVASADINRVNGRRASAIAVRKESSANTVEVAKRVEAVLEEIRSDKRVEGSDFIVFFSQGDLIAESNRTLRDAALTGGLFSVLVLWIFLREWRMTLLISASIPFSLLITITVLYFRGDSLNLIGTMGLMLAVGMVVDNAIVVIESIYRRRAEGIPLQEAAVGGTAEVGLAIVASTATTMVVFLPVILMSEDADAGFFLEALGLPVVFALGASLLVALVFAPLATRFVGGGEIKPDPAWLTWLSGKYEALLQGTLRRRADATASIIATLMLTVMVAVPGVQCTQSAEGGLNDFNIRFTVPRDATPRQREDVVHTLEDIVEADKDRWAVRAYRAELDGSATRGEITVFLKDDGELSREEVIEEAKTKLPKEIPGVTASIGWSQENESSQMKMTIFGQDMAVLEELGDEVVRRVQHVDGVLAAERDIDDQGLDEIRLRPDREALNRYGVSAMSVASTVAFAMRGRALDPIGTGLTEVDVETRLELEDRSDLETLLDFPVFSPVTMSLVPVRALADSEYGKGPQSIRRQNRRTSIQVTIDLQKDVERSDITPALGAALEDMALPRGYSVDNDDWRAEQDAENAAIFFAMGMSVCFVYLLMGILFESWLLPVSILATIPMAMMGAFWGLFLTDTPMDTMAGIGLIVLNGVVVNNGIVLVDLITQLRHEGMPRDEAIREACRRRLRPILMTAVTTIFGLLPMAFGSSDFIGIPYAPLGRTVIGGLTAATVLTLVFVPWLYAVLDDLRNASLRWVQFVRG
jgi:HAE1 family hydrophobic/amphiphilic exporter-1